MFGQGIFLVRLLAGSANQSVWRCWAYEEDGTVCGCPAVAVDAERGYTVCARHARRDHRPGADQERLSSHSRGEVRVSLRDAG